jgi:hypothetical protein
MLIFHRLSTKLLPTFVSLIFLLSLNGCQLTTQTSNNRPKALNYSHYYVWLKALSEQELLAEIKTQKETFEENKVLSKTKSSATIKTHSHTQDTYTQSHAKMMLLYSLPTSPIYQPYAAKTLLNDTEAFKNKNKLNQSNNGKSSTNQHSTNTEHLYNLAFMLLLKDQLNAQLQLLKTQAAIETKAKQRYAMQNAIITQLEQNLQQLQKIEENLSQHQELNK